MPPQFKDGNICQLLMNYVMMMNATHPETDITITDEGCYDWTTLPSEHGFELYRMMQEAVGNALKHARPGYIAVTLGGDAAGRYSMTIENDGIITDGTAGPREGTGIGRQTLQARAANIGATISIGADGDIYRITIQH